AYCLVDNSVKPVPPGPSAAPRWVNRLCIGLVAYVCICAIMMLGGIGGERVTHYIGLLSDATPNLIAVIVTAAASNRCRSSVTQFAWMTLALGLTLYLIGTLIPVSSWLHGIDPFPGVSDVFFSTFYPAMIVAAFLLIRASSIRVPWVQLSLDATICVVGFGT